MFTSMYAPTYRIPFYATLGVIIWSWINYFLVYVLLKGANRYRAKKLERMSLEEIEEENVSDRRLSDKKWTFVYTT